MTNLPVTGVFKITCEYGKKGNTWKAGFHTGIDIVSENRKVYGTCDGKVYQSGYDKSYGNFVVVKSNDNYYHWFCHLDEVFVKIGDKISRVSEIGIMGMTGNATGVHLHYEIRKKCNCYGQVIDPSNYMGISNVLCSYNSINYQIKKYKNGDIIYINVLDTGGDIEGIGRLIEIKQLKDQFWVNKKLLNDNFTILKLIVCFYDGEKLLVELENKVQFYINESDVIN